MESSGSLQGGTRTSTSRRGENAHVDTRDRRVLQPITARTCDESAPLPSNGIVYCGYKPKVYHIVEIQGEKKEQRGLVWRLRGAGEMFASSLGLSEENRVKVYSLSKEKVYLMRK